MSEQTPATGSIRSYTVVLPPGWSRIPVTNPEPVVNRILDDAFRDLPTDKYGPIRREAEKALQGQLSRARDAGGLDLYLPVGGARGLPMPASFVVSHLPPQQPGSSAPADADGQGRGSLTALVLADLLGGSSDDVAPIGVAGAPAVRRERVVPAGGQQPDGSINDGATSNGATNDGAAAPTFDLPTRRVDYVVPVPDDGGWLLVSFSVGELDLRAPAPEGEPPGTGARLTDLLVELFDAVMTTLRWRTT